MIRCPFVYTVDFCDREMPCERHPEQAIRLAVTGSRHWSDATTIWRELDAIRPRPSCLIHGGARGVDEIAARWALARGVVTAVVRPANPQNRGDYLTRNGIIVDLADGVLAFRAPGKSNGTDDTIRKAEAAAKLIRVVEMEYAS